jgi:hypothetical protein
LAAAPSAGRPAGSGRFAMAAGKMGNGTTPALPGVTAVTRPAGKEG